MGCEGHADTGSKYYEYSMGICRKTQRKEWQRDFLSFVIQWCRERDWMVFTAEDILDDAKELLDDERRNTADRVVPSAGIKACRQALGGLATRFPRSFIRETVRKKQRGTNNRERVVYSVHPDIIRGG
ncbi:MAG: hypothetical protein MJH10_19595 [Epibacterium sp.]|nr:hypothetical protein [Epibacterium sp.]NQX75689.1 hypothetical protein [Epibacterium sp.]